MPFRLPASGRDPMPLPACAKLGAGITEMAARHHRNQVPVSAEMTCRDSAKWGAGIERIMH